MTKKWLLWPFIQDELKNQFPEISPSILQLLYNRGLRTQKDIDEFLLPDYSQDLHDPYLLLDMRKAVERIWQAVKKQEKVIIYGDFDADGITSTALLYKTLLALGLKASTYLPSRDKEGYSLNAEIVEKFTNEKMALIITCDCGIASYELVNHAQKQGIDVIITDHHREPEILPDAYAIINPHLKREKYPFKDLAGVGVAFKLAQALFRSEDCSIKNKESVEKWLLDLVAVGTIADLMPLMQENRTLVKYGLLVLNKTRNHGLKFLIEKCNLILGDINSGHIGFQISPRLNAAGRISHPNEALKLILAEEHEAEDLANKLDDLNETRQRIIEKSFEKLKSKLNSLATLENIIVELVEDCPIGALGLVANKISGFYSRPAVILARGENNIRGSGRSLNKAFDLHGFLSSFSGHFESFGGHRAAVGFSLKDEKNYENFKKDLEQKASQIMNQDELCPEVKIDALVQLKDADWNLYEELTKFEPYGIGNLKPLFLCQNIPLKKIEVVGHSSQHYRLLAEGGKRFIYFSPEQNMNQYKVGDRVDIVFDLSVNQWNGEQTLNFKVIDLKLHQTNNFNFLFNV